MIFDDPFWNSLSEVLNFLLEFDQWLFKVILIVFHIPSSHRKSDTEEQQITLICRLNNLWTAIKQHQVSHATPFVAFRHSVVGTGQGTKEKKDKLKKNEAEVNVKTFI